MKSMSFSITWLFLSSFFFSFLTTLICRSIYVLPSPVPDSVSEMSKFPNVYILFFPHLSSRQHVNFSSLALFLTLQVPLT